MVYLAHYESDCVYTCNYIEIDNCFAKPYYIITDNLTKKDHKTLMIWLGSMQK